MVRLRTRLWSILIPAALLLPTGSGFGQTSEPAPEPPPAEAPAAAPPKKRPPPPRKPKPKPAPAAEAAPVPPAPAPAPVPPAPAPAPMPAANLPGLTVQCEARAALYEGPKDFTLWVTRTGLIVVENPLRPLTPETTRVLQVVIAGKAATAYGPDLYALRRGGSPGGLEAMLGAPIRWDGTPTALPDTLNIVSETGQSLAQLGFRECGEAPAVKAPPVAAKDKAKSKERAKERTKARAGAAPGTRDSSVRTPPGLNLPQGAIE